MKTFLSTAALAAAMLCGGCATPSNDGEIAVKRDDARTGTNISRRERAGVKTISREELERQLPGGATPTRTGRSN